MSETLTQEERTELLENRVFSLEMKVKLLISILADVTQVKEPRFLEELKALDAHDGEVV